MKYLPILFLLAVCSSITAQDLLESRQTSYYTYIFKINDQEAKKIYKKDLWQVDHSYFHTIIDSVQTDSVYKKNLPEGHYIRVHTERNKLKFDITSVQDFDVMIAKNNSDLVIQVYDLQGNIIPDAKVKVRWKTLGFDKRTRSYIDRKSNQKGLLQVSCNGFTAYYDLSRQYNNSGLKRTTRKVVYGTPIKYVWIPVRYVIFLPIDGVKSLVNGYPQGTIQRTGRFFTKTYYKIACLFDDYYCDYYGDNRFQEKHKGYLVFNKPKYMPGDTVKLKAFIVNKRGNPINNPLDIVLQRPGKNLTLATVSPYRKGGFVYEFHLHDSLELQLDRSYRIWLEKKDAKEYISESFHYEDYELKSINLDLISEEEIQYRGKKLQILAKGTDENELNILDGRLEIFVKPIEVHTFLNGYVFVPDTLAYWNLDLERDQDTEILISDSIFPEANMTYEVAITLLTSDNEKITERKDLTFYHFHTEISHELHNDSIRFSLQKNGVEKYAFSEIFGVDNFGNQTLVTKESLPTTIEINPYYSDYIVKIDSMEKRVNLSTEQSLVQCFSERSKDSIHLVVKNPRNLPFTYFIYKKNSEKDRGQSDSLNLDFKSSSKQNYFLSIQYLWGGRLYDNNYQIPYKDKVLSISVLEPKIVYPSQETTIELLVTDPGGKPVPNVDITAYSITKKFDYNPPTVPYLGDTRKNKTVINNFSFSDQSFENHPGLNLDFHKWRLLAGLDTIEYYKFIYPGNEIYTHEYDSEITQFSPFVVSQGGILPIHVIYVDSKPVYFSWSTHTQPFAFEIDSGYHNLKLRTTNNTFEIDSLYFQAHKKSIISIWDSIRHKSVSIAKSEPRLSDYEKRLLYKYIFPYQYRYGEQYAYLKQNNQIQFLKPFNSGSSRNLAGPILPNNAKFQLIDSFSIDFTHEPLFEYEFMPELLKMRSVDPKYRYPDYLHSYLSKTSLSDEVLDEEDLFEAWSSYIDWKRYSTARYHYPRSTSAGMGEMRIHISKNDANPELMALNTLLFRYDDHEFLRIYPGNISLFNDLAEGYYKLLLFYPGSEYSVVDSLFIQNDGLNYHQIARLEILQKDSFSIEVSRIIEDNIFLAKPYYQAEETELKQIYNAYQQEFRFTGSGDIVSGYVFDDEGNPLPGVNVVVKGTTFGTVTNIDGYYSLNVPIDRNELLFSFIGFNQEVVDISYKDEANVYLEASVMALDEVVVVGYGVQRKSEMTAAVSVVSTSGIPGVESNIVSALQGKVSGVEIVSTSAPGSAVSITIRGVGTTDFEAQPLYVIDGVVYMGDIGELDPNLIQNIQILKDEQATAMYGSRGSNGVVLISTGGSFQTAGTMAVHGADYDDTFLEAASNASSIRSDFSDYAFWEPTLTSDANGKVSFTVKFPDDVTSWRTFYLAMNGNRQSGQKEGRIKSYKPLMAQLAVPRFLVEGDTTSAIGKVLNYTSDSLVLKTKFEVANEQIFEQDQICIHSIIDTLELTTSSSDSISIKYYLEKKDGYFDGEQRSIPVFPIGLEETIGQFHTLNNDTTLVLNLDTLGDEITLYARAEVIEEIEEEISKLVNYKYTCNEQLASKLKALLSEQVICNYQKKDFKRSNQVEKVIRLLLRNQHEDGLWGWWKSSKESSLWISVHVLEALAQAKEMGHRISINESQIAEMLVWELESPAGVDHKLRALKILKMLNSKVNFAVYIDRIEKAEQLTMNHLFRLIELKQLCSLEPQIDDIDTYRRETIFGNLYFSDSSINHRFYVNDVQNTLIAYSILRSDSTANHEKELQNIRNYLFEKRASGNWLNTYESSRVIETILPELLEADNTLTPPKVTISGSINASVEEFPYESKVTSSDSIQVLKTGDFPVYLTAYSHNWNSEPVIKNTDFEVSTQFDNENSGILEAGETINLVARVKVLKDAEFVMINVPIPAGCSYGDKSVKTYSEVHREYFRNETAIFCEDLRAGTYEFTINLVPRYSGMYTLNPAKAELMYFPTFNANNGIKKVTIK